MMEIRIKDIPKVIALSNHFMDSLPCSRETLKSISEEIERLKKEHFQYYKERLLMSKNTLIAVLLISIATIYFVFAHSDLAANVFGVCCFFVFLIFTLNYLYFANKKIQVNQALEEFILKSIKKSKNQEL